MSDSAAAPTPHNEPPAQRDGASPQVTPNEGAAAAIAEGPSPSAAGAPLAGGGSLPAPAASPQTAGKPLPTPGGPRPTTGGPSPAAKDYVTVWSRTEPKYRVRAVLLLVLTWALFSGLCVFTHWLHVARPFDFSWDSYAAPLKFWGEQTQNLNDFVLYPINVEQNPIHGVVLGLLVASIVAVPISVAILYTFPYALPFAAAVFVLAHMPWMGITLVLCCLLASVKPFRLSFRFGAALVGMLPVILYLLLASRGTPAQVGAYASPDQRLMLAAPWVLAVIAACGMLAAILGISWLVNYRPGAVAPVMAVMFATPAVLFHLHVGTDEVSYRVLESRHGPRSDRFAPRDVTAHMLETLGAWLEDPQHHDLLMNIWAGQTDSLLAVQQRVAHAQWREFLADRRAAYEECGEFIANYPKSRYVPNVLYIQARFLDARIDPTTLRPPRRTLRRELYTDYPHVQSEDTWLALIKGHPDSPLSIAARLRVAQLRLRRGDVGGAEELLADLSTRATAHAAPPGATQPAARLRLGGSPPESSLAFDPQPYLRDARRLLELIQANRDDPRYGTAPLQALAGLDPHRPRYREQLLTLAHRYPDSLLHDNLLVLWAEGAPEPQERAAALAACVRRFPAGDAVAQALFVLGEIDLQARGADQEARRQSGRARLADVAERFPHTCWGREAAERLRLTPTGGDAPPSAGAPATSIAPADNGESTP